ncbi:7 transmembrane receptor (rhodopsin family) domain-containing protein [Phthorimaea operculella]|nr:7 transmembrane receptor (rhodopsin family) domain-containing protein [Phthorimaea operculella]
MSNYTFLETTLKDLACHLIPGYGCSNTTLQTGLECNIPGENEPFVDYNCVLNIDIQNETSYSCTTCLNQTLDNFSNNTQCSFSFKLNLVTIIFESALKSLWLRLPLESCDFNNFDTLTCYNDFFNRTLYIDDSFISVNRTVYENFTCSWYGNGSSGSFGDKVGYDWSFLFVIVFIVAGGVGNILVCLAVCLDKRLQNVTNYFLLSLAIADLLVSLFVMPMGAIPGFLGYWPLGVVWCNVYVTCDVLACSASIMHMCFISIGR